MPWLLVSCVKRVQHGDAAAIEVAHIAGDEGERVDLGGGGDEHVGLAAHLATGRQQTAHFSAPASNGFSHFQHTAAGDKFIEKCRPSFARLTRKAKNNFIHRDH